MVKDKVVFSVADVVSATSGSSSHSQGQFVGVGTDTRKNLKGQLFIALKGDQFDAHDFIEKAVAAGAAGILVHQDVDSNITKNVVVVRVKDTLRAMQDLALFWRRKNNFKVFALTGSNGKTTSKEFSAQLLRTKFRISYSQGSLNNHWGVPMSLLAAPPSSQILIQEMGMNHSGEIARLCEIAEPNVVVVTMVGSSHIGELGSREAIAEAKEEIYLKSPNAVGIFNIDNEFTMAMHERFVKAHPKNRVITFSAFNPAADVYLRVTDIRGFQIEVQGKIGGVSGRCLVSVVGRHNVVNLMTASCFGLAAEMTPDSIWQEMPSFRGAWGRNQLVTLQNNCKVLFDAYNANPESMAALLKNLFEIDVKGKKVAVLGAMMELGSESEKAHFELGALTARSDMEVIWFYGPFAKDFAAGLKSENFEKTSYISDSYEESLATEVGNVLNPSDIVVIKGSRAMKMERVLEAWNPVDFSSHKG